MSAHSAIRRITAPDIRARKGAAPIVSLTAYISSVAALVDPHVDFILVGDSLGMVVHGLDSTVPVSLDLMILHGKAVMRASSRALVVVDMPFGTYEESREIAFRNAVQVMKEAGCGAVKLEGGVTMAPTIKFLVDRGIPVMAHIGLTPQHVNTLGGFKAQGRRREQWAALEADAKAVADAGAFAVVLEAVPAELADKLTAAVPIPTIGIGASAGCDGQILVIDDMLGMFPRVPKFVKKFGRVGDEITAAVSAYAAEVKARTFPAAENTYGVLDDSPKAKPSAKA